MVANHRSDFDDLLNRRQALPGLSDTDVNIISDSGCVPMMSVSPQNGDLRFWKMLADPLDDASRRGADEMGEFRLFAENRPNHHRNLF